MDKQTEEILEGLKTAIEAEITGYEFYKNAAENTSDPTGKETFLRMAEEEMGHFNYLRLQNRIKDSHFEVSALNIGMKLELDAMNFYRSRAENAHNEEAKQFYNELAEWEQDHYHAFQRALEMLKEEYFQANNFIPM